MTLNEAKSLKVGDLVRYYNKMDKTETLEIVLSEWEKRCVTLQTIAVMNEGDDKAKVGDKGWINEYNHGCFERIA